MKKLNREETIKRAVKKAVENGYKTSWLKRYENDDFWYKLQFKGNHEHIIFDKEFCIAFWGEELHCKLCGSDTPIFDFDDCGTESCPLSGYKYAGIPAWNYHRHQMLDSDDYIEYLRGFV